MTSRIAVVGATGRLGRLICALVEAAPDLELVARLGSADSLERLAGADIAVDVTRPEVSGGVVSAALDLGVDVLVGTSGWDADRIDALQRRLSEAPERTVAIIPNFSLGSVLATRFAEFAAGWFDSVEIVETHHPGKVDSPSGTAVRTAERIAAARESAEPARGPVSAPHADQRARGQLVAGIPVHSLRLAGAVAKQEVVFGGTGEILTITHDTLSPEAYEAGILGALRAIPGASGLVVGLDDLLGIS